MPLREQAKSKNANGLEAYAGRWVALLGERVVGQGGTPAQAQHAASQAQNKENPQVIFVPTSTALSFPPLLERIRLALPAGVPVYLVGGAVRDALLGRTVHDLDFAVPADALNTARRLADQIGAAYYPMDSERDIARLVLVLADEGERYVIDFAAYQGPDLESDLRNRDFTINALAVDVRQPQALLDPLGGLADLLGKRLRACSPASFQADPLRILRAVRQAAALNLKIVPESLALMRQAVARLPDVSVERLRDEFFRIIDGSQPATALRALEMLGVLPLRWLRSRR
jgi:tRNA nucleotidyltransferase/poly(A) polymerase